MEALPATPLRAYSLATIPRKEQEKRRKQQRSSIEANLFSFFAGYLADACKYTYSLIVYTWWIIIHSDNQYPCKLERIRMTREADYQSL
jgi:hypothetical protein